MRGLENKGIRCWIAPRDVQPGLSFAGEITRAIEHSKVMVLIFSAHSNTSAQILREVQLAANSHLHIVQFRIEDVVPKVAVPSTAWFVTVSDEANSGVCGRR